MSDDIDIGEISEALNDKLDRDAGNPATIGKERITSWGMPSDTYENLTLGADGSTYEAPASGYYHITGNFRNQAGYVGLSNAGGLTSSSVAPFAGNGMNVSLPAKKGEIITLRYNTPVDNPVFRFYYAKGEENV